MFRDTPWDRAQSTKLWYTWWQVTLFAGPLHDCLFQIVQEWHSHILFFSEHNKKKKKKIGLTRGWLMVTGTARSTGLIWRGPKNPEINSDIYLDGWAVSAVKTYLKQICTKVSSDYKYNYQNSVFFFI